MNNIKWRKIPGYEDRYLCSEHGDIFGIVRNKIKAKVFSQNGYLKVNLYGGDKYRSASIHTIVAEVFIGPRPEGKQVNHIDGNKKNNSVENLEYVTPIENIHHAIALGLNTPVGEDNSSSKLREIDVLDICKMLDEGKFTQKQIGQKHKVSQTAVSFINLGKTWNELTGRRGMHINSE